MLSNSSGNTSDCIGSHVLWKLAIPLIFLRLMMEINTSGPRAGRNKHPSTQSTPSWFALNPPTGFSLMARFIDDLFFFISTGFLGRLNLFPDDNAIGYTFEDYTDNCIPCGCRGWFGAPGCCHPFLDPYSDFTLKDRQTTNRIKSGSPSLSSIPERNTYLTCSKPCEQTWMKSSRTTLMGAPWTPFPRTRWVLLLEFPTITLRLAFARTAASSFTTGSPVLLVLLLTYRFLLTSSSCLLGLDTNNSLFQQLVYSAWNYFVPIINSHQIKG